MSEWTYVYGAYGLTWISIAAYGLYLRGRRARAARAASSSAASSSRNRGQA